MKCNIESCEDIAIDESHYVQNIFDTRHLKITI